MNILISILLVMGAFAIAVVGSSAAQARIPPAACIREAKAEPAGGTDTPNARMPSEMTQSSKNYAR